MDLPSGQQNQISTFSFTDNSLLYLCKWLGFLTLMGNRFVEFFAIEKKRRGVAKSASMESAASNFDLNIVAMNLKQSSFESHYYSTDITPLGESQLFLLCDSPTGLSQFKLLAY